MWTAESLETTRLVRNTYPRLRAQRTTQTAAFKPLVRRDSAEPSVDPAGRPRAHEAGLDPRGKG
jgi:hypothetical protein